MGYRLSVSELKNEYYGTKHYGYCVKEEQELASYKYLKSIGKVDGDEIFDYCCENPIVLDAEQFRTFIDLYNKEYMSGISWQYPHNILEEEEIKKLCESSYDKLIRWY